MTESKPKVKVPEHASVSAKSILEELANSGVSRKGALPNSLPPSPSLSAMRRYLIGPDAIAGEAVSSSVGLSLDLMRKHQDQINELQRQKLDLIHQLSDSNAGQKEYQAKLDQAKTVEAKLRYELDINYLLERVNNVARKALMERAQLSKAFEEGRTCNAFVMSIDIRRSTDLMLKARTPQLFADFITTLCEQMMNVVKENFGVVNKFTGDGILAFFPDFFTGPSAGYRALDTASKCHDLFRSHYANSRKAFSSVITETGLGIGIDFGEIQLVRMPDGLTVVGIPVVYACRFGGANAGQTLLNQPAFEEISCRFSSSFFIEETEIFLKHEGNMLAYSVTNAQSEFVPEMPEWVEPMNSQLSQGESVVNADDSSQTN